MTAPHRRQFNAGIPESTEPRPCRSRLGGMQEDTRAEYPGVNPAAKPFPPPAGGTPAGRLLKTGLSLSVWALAGIATVLPASGQVGFAHGAGITDTRADPLPAAVGSR